jgi:2-succinyl-6-hydroxy-2,4-cyclohexadiene-1-carboxylate synthase
LPTITVNDISYYYEIAGQSVTETAQPLVLLHGFTGSVANWHEPVHHFGAARPIVTIDLLGHGHTAAPADPARYRMAESAADLVDLLAIIAPGPVNLLGYSMGGRLALYLAVTYPHLINKLILESASPGLAEPAARAARVHSDEALADQIERDGIGAFVEYWARIPLFASQQRLPVALRQRLRDQRLQNRPHGLANSLRGMGTGVQPSLWDRLSALTVPVLLLTGEDDDKFDAIAQQMATRLPNARHQTIPQAGHTIHLEQPEAYWATVGAFLNEQ